MRIALVNCRVLPEPDIDEAPLLEALRASGHDAQTAAWDDPGADWAGFDVAVLRATWNYHTQPEAFDAWLGEVERHTLLLNPAEVVRWNMHKDYLRHFHDRRIPIVPTEYAPRDASGERGSRVIQRACERGWSRLVVKPCVSAGSRDTRVFDLSAGRGEAEDFARSLVQREDIMVQSFLRSVETGGEVAIITIDGRISHAIQKLPRFSGQDEQIRGHGVIPEAERRFAESVLSACPFRTLYARVDVMRTDEGGLALSELELIEPSLYFPFDTDSPARMVEAIVRHASLARA